MTEFAERICEAGRILFSRRLTDLAGGNISARQGEMMVMSPRYAGQRYHWDLQPDNLVRGRWADDEITLDPHFSREGWAHLYLYRNFPEIGAIIHAHPFHVMPFVAYAKPIPPIMEGTQKFGVVEVCAQAPAHSRQLAENVLAAMRGKEDQMRKQAAAVILPYHGIILAGNDFDKTMDALERIDENAYCLLMGKLIE
jgi:L-fuculose-phosphate aldolase